MTNKFTLILILLITFACANNDLVLEKILKAEVKQVKGELVQPVLLMDIIEIPSNGRVFLIEGSAEIKKAKVNQYIDVKINTIVGPGDILWIKKDSIIGIKFNDTSHFKNKPKSKDTYLTFELK